MTCRSVSEGEEMRLNEDEQSRVKVRLRSQARQEGKDIALLDTQGNYRTCTPGRISWGSSYCRGNPYILVRGSIIRRRVI